MIRAALLLLVLGFVAVVIRLPASLADAWLSDLGDGQLRLARAQGSLWDGAGEIVVADSLGEAWRRVAAVKWHLTAAKLWRGAIGLRVGVDGGQEALVEASPGGVRVVRLDIAAAAGDVLGRIPNSVARAGWRGDLAVSVGEWRCDWSWRCTGHAELTWTAAGSDLFPGRRFGDYRLVADGQGEATALTWTTLDGDIRIDGTGSWRPGGAPNFGAVVSGDPRFLERLPSVAGRWVRPGESPGVWRVSIGG